jgi:competence protein ComEA
MFKSLVALSLSMFAVAAMAAVDVNKADQAQLESVKGIGPALSTKILDQRKTGAFKDWSDFKTRVSGIGPGNAARLSGNGLTVNGAAYTAGDAAAPRATAKASERKPAEERK